jgi:predicted ribosome quality control (RQC) complex YloA/Tae2 family protein
LHNNYYFLIQLCRELREIFTDSVLAAAYSQDKDELILHFVKQKENLFVKADLNPQISCLSFPAILHRAKRNSADLFNELIGSKITEVRQFENERCFSFMFDDGKELLFKLFGNRSNILLYHNKQCIELFRNQLSEDAEINPDQLAKSIDWSKAAFLANHAQLKKLYFTFGKVLWDYLEKEGFQQKNLEEQWTMLLQLKAQLESSSKFYIDQDGDKIKLSFFSSEKTIKSSIHAIEAINLFYQELNYQSSTQTLKLKAISKLQSKIKAAKQYINKTNEKADALQTASSYKHMADLIMANLHQIPKGAHEVTVADIYHNDQPLLIKLKPEQSAQKNAEVFYRKAKNQQIQIDKLNQSIESKRAEIKKCEEIILELETANELKLLKQIIARHQIDQGTKQEKIILPYHAYAFNNFKILIGKNAAANDELTLKHCFKEDLWLHAKDVAGSHVVLKYQSGKSFPKDVIERAAQLAAFYSKRKTESMCPVIFTPKKFVRKRKGAAPGEVIVEREQVIMVEPRGIEKS